MARLHSLKPSAQFLNRQRPVGSLPDILHGRDRLQRPAVQQTHRGPREGAPIDVSGAFQDMRAAQHPQRPVLPPCFEAGEKRGLDLVFGGRLVNCLGIRRDESAARAKQIP